ncbi:MAG: DUF1214 domain-containing protein [Solimonas sp.]
MRTSVRTLLRYGLAVVAGIAVGLGSAWWALGRVPAGERYGAWQSDPLIGSRAADLYTRARIARHGLLALNRDEALYLVATQDDAGRPLSPACDYTIAGRPLPAPWWSLTLYADDEFLPRNGEQAYAIDAAHVVHEADGRWQARLAAERGKAVNWLASAGTGRPSLVLRLYRPAAAPGVATLPTITRDACRGASP